MGYLLRVRLSSFFAGAATAAFTGLYILHSNYKEAYDSTTQKMKDLHESLDRRISALEASEVTQVSQPLEATE